MKENWICICGRERDVLKTLRPEDLFFSNRPGWPAFPQFAVENQECCIIDIQVAKIKRRKEVAVLSIGPLS